MEEYVFGRLNEADIENFEEHLLICQPCQGALAEVDEYILLIREAAARVERKSYSARSSASAEKVFQQFGFPLD
jgi:hypothetical protein